MVNYTRKNWEQIYESPDDVYTIGIVDIDFENGKYKVSLFMPRTGLPKPNPRRDIVVVDYIDLEEGGFGESGHYIGCYTIRGTNPEKHGKRPFLGFYFDYGTKIRVYKNKKSGKTVVTDKELYL